MLDDAIRIGYRVNVVDEDDDVFAGRVDYGHAGDWFVRTSSGELTGPWQAEQLHLIEEVGTWLQG